MRILVMFFTLLLNLILQSTIFQYIEVFGVKPNITLLIVICYSILKGDVEGSILGFFAGLLQDMFFGYYLGLYAFLFFIVGFLCGKPFRNFYRENYLLPFVLVFFSVLGYNMVFCLINFIAFSGTSLGYYFTKIILPETVYTTLLTFFVYRTVYVINRRLEKREKKKEVIFK